MRIGDTIYLDHQATTPVDKRVLEVMVSFFSEQFGNPHSSDHILGWDASNAVENARVNISQLIGSDPDEIIFTSGATESNNLALIGTARNSNREMRRRILISSIEHKSILTVGQLLGDHLGYSVELIPVDGEGFIDLLALKKLINEDVLLVSTMAVNNEIGTIQNLKEISSICQEFGVILHSDCAQAPCALSLADFSNFVDLLSLSGHKMYGPKGIGILYVRREIMNSIEPIIYGGDQQDGLRSGTIPVPLCVGMGEAAQLLIGTNFDAERTRIGNLRNKLIQGLQSLPWRITLNGPLSNQRHPCNANLTFHGFDAQEILGILQPKLAASTGSACTTGVPEVSHVLSAIGLSEMESRFSLRFSLGRLTTNQDISDAVTLVDEALSIHSDHLTLLVQSN